MRIPFGVFSSVWMNRIKFNTMKEIKRIQCTRCRMGVPLGITVALIGLAGIIASALFYDRAGLFGLIAFVGLFLIGPPFARMALLVNGAHMRIDKLEKTSLNN